MINWKAIGAWMFVALTVILLFGIMLKTRPPPAPATPEVGRVQPANYAPVDTIYIRILEAGVYYDVKIILQVSPNQGR